MNRAPIEHVSAASMGRAQLRYYDFVMAAFVAILLLSNIVGAAKPAVVELPFVGTWTFGAGVLFFPVSYIIGDVLTEVYGYARARRVIWAGFAALTFYAFMAVVVLALPPAPGWPGQEAYQFVFGNGWRIVMASMAAFIRWRVLANNRCSPPRRIGMRSRASRDDSHRWARPC